MTIPERSNRIVRKSLVKASGAINAGKKSLASIPGALIESATEVFTPSTNKATRASRIRLAKLGSNLAIGAAAGGLVAGPAGAVVGLAMSFVQTAVSNVTEATSGHSQKFQENIGKGVRSTLEQSKPNKGTANADAPAEPPSTLAKLKAVFKGTLEGVKSEFRHGKFSGKAQTAGFIDGLNYDRKLPKLSLGKDGDITNIKDAINRTARAGMGVIGSILSFPGGIIVGGLEAIKNEEQDLTPTIKPLLRLCTGLGKAIIPGILGGLVAGPAGAAVATGAGLLFDISVDGINTISDGGEKGVNTAMQVAIEDSLEEALPDDAGNSGYGTYYRFGKGAAVGAQVSLAEGWKRGYYGGVESLKALIESPFQAKEPEQTDKSDN